MSALIESYEQEFNSLKTSINTKTTVEINQYFGGKITTIINLYLY